MEHWLHDSPLPFLGEEDLDFFQSMHDIVRDNDINKLRSLLLSCSLDNAMLRDERNDAGLTPLHVAAKHGSYESASLLLQHANSSQPPSQPQAPLSMRCFENGWTPLHYAFYYGRVRVALLLLKAERNGEASAVLDEEGLTPTALLSLVLQQPVSSKGDVADCASVTSVMAFGRADFQLGVPLPNRATTLVAPKMVDSLDDAAVVSVHTSRFHSAAVTAKGRLLSWGHGKGGRLGLGSEQTMLEPQEVVFPPAALAIAHNPPVPVCIVSVSLAENHTLAADFAGGLWAWGAQKYGKLGLGSALPPEKESMTHSPQRVLALRKHRVTGVAAGETHSTAHTDRGTLYAWGNNRNAQLGLRPTEVSECWEPKEIKLYTHAPPSDRRICQISAGTHCTLALYRQQQCGRRRKESTIGESDSDVWQVGFGAAPVRVSFAVKTTKETDCKTTPRIHACATRRPVSIIQVSAGRQHLVALSSAGHCYAWGAEYMGHENEYWSRNLPQATTREQQTPQLVEAMLTERGGGKVVKISTSGNRTCALSAVGDVYAWSAPPGENGSYQPTPPARVRGIKRAVEVAAGDEHTIVLLSFAVPQLPLSDLIAETDDEGVTYNSTESDDDQPMPGMHSALRSFANGRDNLDAGVDVDADSEEQHDEEEEEEEDEDDYGEDDDLLQLFSDTAETAKSPLERPHYRDQGDVDAIHFKFPPSLKQLSERELARNITISNAASMLSIAEAVGADALSSVCEQFVRENFDAVLMYSRTVELDAIISDEYGEAIQRVSSGSSNGYSGSIADRMRSCSRTSSMGGDDLYTGSTDRSASIDESNTDMSKQDAADDNTRHRTASVDMADLNSVSKRVRAIRKKIAAIEALQAGGAEAVAALSKEQQEKVSRKALLQSELRQILFVMMRLEKEKAKNALDSSQLDEQATIQEEVGAAVSSNNKPKVAKQPVADALAAVRMGKRTAKSHPIWSNATGTAGAGSERLSLPKGAAPPSFSAWSVDLKPSLEGSSTHSTELTESPMPAAGVSVSVSSTSSTGGSSTVASLAEFITPKKSQSQSRKNSCSSPVPLTTAATAASVPRPAAVAEGSKAPPVQGIVAWGGINGPAPAAPADALARKSFVVFPSKASSASAAAAVATVPTNSKGQPQPSLRDIQLQEETDRQNSSTLPPSLTGHNSHWYVERKPRAGSLEQIIREEQEIQMAISQSAAGSSRTNARKNVAKGASSGKLKDKEREKENEKSPSKGKDANRKRQGVRKTDNDGSDATVRTNLPSSKTESKREKSAQSRPKEDSSSKPGNKTKSPQPKQAKQVQAQQVQQAQKAKAAGSAPKKQQRGSGGNNTNQSAPEPTATVTASTSRHLPTAPLSATSAEFRPGQVQNLSAGASSFIPSH